MRFKNGSNYNLTWFKNGAVQKQFKLKLDVIQTWNGSTLVRSKYKMVHSKIMRFNDEPIKHDGV